MKDIPFVDRVKKHFNYLQSDYGFKVAAESNSDIRPETDGAVEYISHTTGVVIDSETGSAAVWIYRIKDGKMYRIGLASIHEYLTTNSREKELLLSTSPADNSAAIVLFNQKFLLNQPGWKSDGSTEEKLEIRLFNQANWLREHASICLTNDFPNWQTLYEYKIHRSRADHLRLGKDEMGYARVQDNEGKWKMIKQSIFKDQLDYIEKLRKEASK